MSFLKKLFGGGAPAAPSPGKSLDHKGFAIEARPFKEGGQFQTAGRISKEIDGTVQSHDFIRADRFTTAEEAADHAFIKGRQIVDEQAERMFQPRT